MFWKRIGTFILLSWIVFTTPALASPTESPKAIPSGENYVLADGWIYYHFNDTLFRMREDGTGAESLYENEILYLGADSNTLYFSVLDTGGAYSLYRMDSDGGNREGILKGEWDCFEIVGTDAFMSGYYNKSTRGLVKLDLTKPASNKDALKLYHSKVTGDYLTVRDGWIYYKDRESLDGGRSGRDVLYRMRVDGKKHKRLLSNKHKNIELIAVQGGRIYYNLSSYEPDEFSFESIKVDGSDHQIILNDVAAFCVDDNAAYFQRGGEDARGLYKTSLDGKQVSVVTEDVGKLHSCRDAGPWLVYYNVTVGPMMMKKDGSEARVVPGYVHMIYSKEEEEAQAKAEYGG